MWKGHLIIYSWTVGTMINESALVIHTFVPEIMIVDYIMPADISDGVFMVSSGWTESKKTGELVVMKVTKSIFDFSKSVQKRMNFDNLEKLLNQQEEEIKNLRGITNV